MRRTLRERTRRLRGNRSRIRWKRWGGGWREREREKKKRERKRYRERQRLIEENLRRSNERRQRCTDVQLLCCMASNGWWWRGEVYEGALRLPYTPRHRDLAGECCLSAQPIANANPRPHLLGRRSHSTQRAPDHASNWIPASFRVMWCFLMFLDSSSHMMSDFWTFPPQGMSSCHIEIYAVKLLSGPSLAILGVIIWAK